MDLKNVDLLSLQTSYMKQDPTTQALCAALNPHFRQLADEVKACLIYSRIDELDDAALDELAWQMHVDWYDSTAEIEIKRSLIKNAINVHRYRGTPFAVEETVKTYFGDGEVQEWFEYGGQPYYFKVMTTNTRVNTTLLNQFLKVLNSVKNARSWLEAVEITATDEMNLYFGNIVHIADYQEIRQVV